MKIAIILMKGFDGCGVSRFAIEHQLELRKTGNVCDIYSFNKKYVRTKAHDDKDVVFYKSLKELELNDYDIIVINSYPQKFDEEEFEYFKTLKPVKVGMMHEILKMNYNRIPNLWEWMESVDVVSSFSDEMDFTQALKEKYPDKKYFSYRMAMSEQDILDYYNKSLDIEKENRVVYFGRWTTMKDPSRLFKLKALDENIDYKMIGIERSIGAVSDIFENPYCQDFTRKGFVDNLEMLQDGDDVDRTKVQVYTSVNRTIAMDYLNKSKFGASFYRLRESQAHNLGNRMEYTQIELASTCLPLFDIGWGKRTFDIETGKSLYELGNNAVYVDVNDLESAVDEIDRLLNNDEEYKQRRQNLIEIVLRNYNSTYNIPFFYESVKKLMK